MPRIASAVSAIRITLAAIAPPKFERAGLAEQPVDRATGSVGWSGRTMKTVAPNSPSEIANANPAATSAARATIGRSTSRQTRAGRRAEHRRGLAQARVDGAQHRGHHPHDERHRDQRLRDRHQTTSDVRRSSGGVVERDEEAEADGHRRDAERERHQRVEAAPRATTRSANAAAAADDDRDHGGDRGEARASCAIASHRRDEQRAARVHARRARGRSRARARRGVERAHDEHRDRHAEQHGHHREVGADERRARAAVRGRSRGLGRGAEPRA